MGRLLVLALLVALAWLPGGPALAQDAESFDGLEAGRHVYDETGSLGPAQVADLETRIAGVRSAGADVVVWVRALDADSDETFDQVEALQQAWVDQTGADQDTAAAILVNRNPDDPTDARAGIFVGRTFAEGNVPENEQRAIVEDALIPPLRDGDVYASLGAGLDRLGNSIRNGPPVSAFDRFAASAAAGWLPWTALAVAVAGLAGALLLFGRRSRVEGRTTPEPTTRRPGDLPPALAGALVGGGPTAGVLPAVLLDLAGRGAIAIEAESEGNGWGSSPKVRVRLLDRALVRDDIERAVWDRLTELAEGDVVDSSGLTKLSSSAGPVREAVRAELRGRGWLDPDAHGVQIGLTVIGAVTALAAIAAIVLAAAGGGPLAAWLGVAALVVAAVAAFWFLAVYPTLTKAGQYEAAPWTAYRDGLKRAAADEGARLDLDTALPDAVAMDIGAALGDRLKAATEAGEPLRAFSGGTSGNAHLATFPWWIAFSTSTAGSMSGTGTVSGGGVGGGGGAAGST
ncbi:MAG TPA: TPM domain-containing protein [Pseudonocardia sp.]|nr:TPM domain-containing protein [Pseudonocardia sp.]